MIYFTLAIIIAYLLGSIPMGLLFTKIMGKGDLRKVGSGNIGATNVMRVGGLRMVVLLQVLHLVHGADLLRLLGIAIQFG